MLNCIIILDVYFIRRTLSQPCSTVVPTRQRTPSLPFQCTFAALCQLQSLQSRLIVPILMFGFYFITMKSDLTMYTEQHISALSLIDNIQAMRDLMTMQHKFVLMFCYARHITCSHYIIYIYIYILYIYIYKISCRKTGNQWKGKPETEVGV